MVSFLSAAVTSVLLSAARVQGTSILGGKNGWTNITVFRVTPKNLTGLLNENSADAAGDVMFGLNQLLLPVLCPDDPGFLWCAPQHPHAGGPVPLVYTKFVVSTDPRFGDYAACNPNNETHIYQCGHFDSPKAGVPQQCAKGYEVYHEDCINGTKYKILPDTTEGKCCEACTADGAKCAAWNIPPGGACELMTDPVVDWSGAATTGCKAGKKSDWPSSSHCWYDDSAYADTFKAACTHEQCSCPAVETLSVGRETRAMCWHHNSSLRNQWIRKNTPSWFSPAASSKPDMALAANTGYWACAAAVFDKCDTADSPSSCSACAQHANISGCNAAWIKAACSPDPTRCSAAVRHQCHAPIAANNTGECRECAFAASTALSQAGCNASLVNDECLLASGGEQHKSEWFEYLDDFACHMNGTWFSTQGEGRCNTTSATEDCWWRIVDTSRMVAHECVEKRLIDVAQHQNPGCWQACPQPSNITTSCFLRCLYHTILGKDKGPGIPASVLTTAFTNAFEAPEHGGCPDVSPSADSAAVSLVI